MALARVWHFLSQATWVRTFSLEQIYYALKVRPPPSHLFSFYTAGFQYGLFYVEGGVSQYDICWYACAGYSGYIAKLGLAGGSGKLTAKVGAGSLELMEQRWMIVEADASYALNENLGISLGVIDLDELGGKVTKMGLRLSW